MVMRHWMSSEEFLRRFVYGNGDLTFFTFCRPVRRATGWKPVLLLSLTRAIQRGYHPHGAAPGWEAALPSLHLPVTRKITRAYPVGARQEPHWRQYDVFR